MLKQSLPSRLCNYNVDRNSEMPKKPLLETILVKKTLKTINREMPRRHRILLFLRDILLLSQSSILVCASSYV